MKRDASRGFRQMVLLTGLSGSGKGSVLRTFEDLGFYCVDNLPVDLITSFSELCVEGGGEIERAALLVDAREGGNLSRLPAIYKKLRKDHPTSLVFIEAGDEALLRRFSETRRPHPLGRELTVREGIHRERRLMTPIRKRADLIIDTTKFNVHELRQFITHRFQNPRRRPMLVSLTSFGYRFGVPSDADLVFDVRFLPNPHFIPALRPKTGRDPRVARYIRSFPQTGTFLRRADTLLAFLIPHYIREGKSYLTIAFGCTGGRHRSVMMAEAMRRALARRGYAVKVSHRDMEQPTP
ncbi:MAG TPA: RNase adapter RapZ [Candidatus Acidoferrales bacterium]|nr:RNase adapter RapZ [Candidatus Acidoferrales bacterium]